MAPSNAIDWPLSREEGRNRISRLYNDEDTIPSGGETALEALAEELDRVRQAAGVQKKISRLKLKDDSESPASQASGGEEVQRLRAAVENASAVLRAILPTPDEDDSPVTEQATVKRRAQSEGCARDSSGVTLRPALCRTPRGERTKPKRKVSFGNAPEDEPMRRAATTDSEDEDIKAECQATPPRNHRNSLDLNAYARMRESPDQCSSGEMDSPREDMASQATEIETTRSIKTKVTWKWSLCVGGTAMAIAMFTYLGPFRADPDSTHMSYGDPACWVGGFRPEYCCFGPGGNSNCWDTDHTYERCCLGEKYGDDA